MEAALPPAPELEILPAQGNQRLAGAKPERSSGEDRRCLATGNVLPKSDLIRFVVGPADAVFPDLAENLPGRGLWVTADYQALTLAVKKGLFTRAAKTKAKAAADLPDQVVKLLRARCLSFIGMAKGAGIAVLGQPQVETPLRAGKLALLLLADDASAELDNRHCIPECRLFTRDELGAALGYAQIVYAGLKPHGLTKHLYAEIKRLDKMLQTSHKEAAAASTAIEQPTTDEMDK